ncbi:hypothetical protein Kpol_1002p101 [Vanderwaltozyma polyspora DSM 70294]|uniref:CDC20/Fizzy WD40 domain-containing protein n=1 Tax=Vanderwaltozyma polyspora (strain ATCC 22028 / DSM 70294 / BCRC 21397 / CBS 2163 / NBRC 10782 / NRRL Y-8283 / UCD 57-17) TaxID=436907 RepID=A7TED1_VANPO|nr:uncharacterized protein Kpol_1002p101 [Vanderwaltozyma polyspora DSM 70294]EDO19453.1 hypothetical protein Kpol_1002p101 [Vanderwaltozyma polyspora DSM 70294]
MLETNESLAFNANRSVLSLTSPAKLNVIATSKSNNSGKITKNSLRRTTSLNIKSSNSIGDLSFNRPKLNLPAPPLIKRNSSFFKEDSLSANNNLTMSNSNQFSSSLQSFSNNNLNSITSTLPTNSQDIDDQHVFQTDRFIPLLSGNSQNKMDPISIREELPPPNASPSAHLKAQTKIVFKQTVAEACGLDVNQRILQYMPQPPVSSFMRKSFSMHKRTSYNYQPKNSNNNPELIKLRKINGNPERILDAPGFLDDFYLNLLSWSSKNILAIALNNALYLWNGASGEVSMLAEYESTTISSVTWSDDDCHISVGRDDGNTEIWDVETMSLIRTMRSNLGVRIGSLSWLDTLIATGSRSGEIQINDVRIKNHVVATWEEHSGEVCGLAYKNDGLQLASGGNDNTVVIWDTRTSMPQFVKRTHNAAVKALSWCPYIPNLLATGGGQTDRHIHFWHTTTGAKVGSINTGSQVSSLHWGQSYGNSTTTPSPPPTTTSSSSTSSSSSGMSREIVATGGNPENAISVFNYDTKFKVAEIEHAHESRICCSQLSPDGTTIATVGGDENLKFYKVFEPRRKFQRRTKNIVDTEDLLGLFSHNNDDDVQLSTQEDMLNENSSISNPTNTSSTTRITSRKTSDYLIR